MPKFTIWCMVNNTGTATVSAHVGASLMGSDGIEYYNTADDIKKDFPPGKTSVKRYLNTELGKVGKYTLYLALWEGEKTIGTGTKYAAAVITDAVEKKKKTVAEVKMEITSPDVFPTSFIAV